MKEACGGRAGIRTLETRERLLLFESSAFSHSATLPFTLNHLKNGSPHSACRPDIVAEYRNNCPRPVSLIVFRLHYNIYAELVKIP